MNSAKDVRSKRKRNATKFQQISTKKTKSTCVETEINSELNYVISKSGAGLNDEQVIDFVKSYQNKNIFRVLLKQKSPLDVCFSWRRQYPTA